MFGLPGVCMSVLRHVAASHGAPLMAKHRRPGSRVGQSGLAAVVNPPVNGFPIRHSSERLVVIRTGHRVVGASAPDRVFGQVVPRTISTSSPAGLETVGVAFQTHVRLRGNSRE